MDILSDNSTLIGVNQQLKTERERRMREEASRRAKSVSFGGDKRKSKGHNSNGKNQGPIKTRSSQPMSPDGSGHLHSQDLSINKFSE